MEYTDIHTLEIEWDCCTTIGSSVGDSVAEEVLSKLYHPLDAFWNMRSLNKLVIRGYTGSRFASSFGILLYIHHTLSLYNSVQNVKSFHQVSQLCSLKELYVEGASSLESFMQDHDMSEEGWQETQTRIAFPRLHKLEFHNMPVWKEWSVTKEGDLALLCKLILKQCPKLRALPHLPLSLKELELEACHELTSLFAFGSKHTQPLKFLKSLRRLSLSAIKGTPPTLQHMSLTNCPLLLAWCEGHPRILADIPNLLINGVRVHTRHEKSIRSQIKRIRKNGKVSYA